MGSNIMLPHLVMFQLYIKLILKINLYFHILIYNNNNNNKYFSIK